MRNASKADERLKMTAGLVRQGSRLLDIGTDHAYLPCYLLLSGVCSCALATDIAPGPLSAAKRTVDAKGLSKRITLLCSDGFEAVEPDCADDIVIAGMGGMLIRDILSRCEWVKKENIRLILQPMTHPEYVRRFLYENGFHIYKEAACISENKAYCAICAGYTGEKPTFSEADCYLGLLPFCDDQKAARLVLLKQLLRLKKRKEALEALCQTSTEEYVVLKQVITQTQKVISMTQVHHISEFIDSTAPFSSQLDWDNSGFLIGDGEKTVEKIGFCLDLCPESLADARKKGVQLIVTHHPVIFKPCKTLLSGNIAYEAAAAGLAVISAHTCYDAADGGVNDVLASLLGLKNVVSVQDGSSKPVPRMGELPCTDGKGLAALTSQGLQTTVRLSDAGRPISKVAVCGGSGGFTWRDALDAGADALVTGEASHHELLDSAAAGLSIIVAGHYETENPAVYALKEKIQAAFPHVETVMLQQKNPVEYISYGT